MKFNSALPLENLCQKPTFSTHTTNFKLINCLFKRPAVKSRSSFSQGNEDASIWIMDKEGCRIDILNKNNIALLLIYVTKIGDTSLWWSRNVDSQGTITIKTWSKDSQALSVVRLSLLLIILLQKMLWNRCVFCHLHSRLHIISDRCYWKVERMDTTVRKRVKCFQ